MLCDGYVYRMDLIFPKSCQLAYDPSPLDDTSNRRPLGRNNGSSNPYWSPGSHRSLWGWLPRDKAIHPLWFINLIWTVAIEEFSYHQWPSTIWHGSIQDLHRYEDPPSVRWYLADGQTQVLKEFVMKGVQGKPKACLEHLFIHFYTVYPFIVAFFWLIR